LSDGKTQAARNDEDTDFDDATDTATDAKIYTSYFLFDLSEKPETWEKYEVFAAPNRPAWIASRGLLATHLEFCLPKCRQA
jgi:hypothetical protein